MLNQIPATDRKDILFGISRRTQAQETVFVTDTYAKLGSLLDESDRNNAKFRDIEMIPITEIRDLETDS
jgi:hypothetical protein